HRGSGPAPDHPIELWPPRHHPRGDLRAEAADEGPLQVQAGQARRLARRGPAAAPAGFARYPWAQGARLPRLPHSAQARAFRRAADDRVVPARAPGLRLAEATAADDGVDDRRPPLRGAPPLPAQAAAAPHLDGLEPPPRGRAAGLLLRAHP